MLEIIEFILQICCFWEFLLVQFVLQEFIAVSIVP